MTQSQTRTKPRPSKWKTKPANTDPSLLAASSVGFILAAVGSAEGFEVLSEFAALESNDMSCWLFWEDIIEPASVPDIGMLLKNAVEKSLSKRQTTNRFLQNILKIMERKPF